MKFREWWFSPMENDVGQVALVAAAAIGVIVGLASLFPSDPCGIEAPCEMYTNVVIGGMQYPLCAKFGEPRVANPTKCAEAEGTD